MAEQFDRQQFSGLNLLPTPLLEEIIQTDFSGEANYSEEMILYVLEMIAERKITEQPEVLPNMQDAWKKLRLRAKEEDGLDLPKEFSIQTKKNSPRRSKRVVRYIAVAAACVAVLFAMLVTVQALGLDVFGAKGSWTDETFRFETAQDDEDVFINSEIVCNELGQALLELGIPTELAPTWIPEGYVLTQVDAAVQDRMKAASVAYSNASDHYMLTIEIVQHFDNISQTAMVFQKNPGKPEVYTKNGKQFYLFQNYDRWSAVWCNSDYGIHILGADSKQTVIAIIDSIQEVPNE